MNELDDWLKRYGNQISSKEKKELNTAKIAKKIEVPQINLHGLTIEIALQKLSNFIKNQTPSIKKILIIHGKGLHNKGKKSPLKNEVRNWLTKKYTKKEIKDFSYASPKDGGHGATIVWLI